MKFERTGTRRHVKAGINRQNFGNIGILGEKLPGGNREDWRCDNHGSNLAQPANLVNSCMAAAESVTLSQSRTEWDAAISHKAAPFPGNPTEHTRRPQGCRGTREGTAPLHVRMPGA